MRRGLWGIFRWPLLIGLLAALGLLSALLGDGLYDVVSWLALGLPLIVIGGVWKWRQKRTGHRAPKVDRVPL
ncbi:hypothetical protein ACU5P1_15555 [Pseudomonas plecoglossicida]|uniref:DUF4175 domain-containing protein n=1 Tax=Pseudomonas plecoglossicida TaxID=70775 RepID=A0AAD0QW94_PSEDL|nr:hypothetical protein [Pseudomonas plecoglossicida]AXM95359.1 hypothetical protein DVB73_05850 [Pseudomonas plecoglossicida]EPB96205.1 hypothetical protein L321_08815 [Pseudomonas plecoglossicida NB2011]QLB56107.1 hypothetical protein HAV28_15390 [Pseudomonas plecoglossicida]GLR39111.1 hypothetical protein GCM10011247_45100 [Pseudomonas plecoglossicida]